MDFEYSNGNFLPYESFDAIFANRKLPEFGNVESPFVREISTWHFYLANGESEIPFGFESQSFDDADWDIMNVPSTWQMEGYGLPQNLLYNYPDELITISKRGEESISDKYLLSSNNSDSDEIGIYRSSVVFTPEDIDRAIYLEASGICGNFDLFLNGKRITSSYSVNTCKRILLSENAHVGVNQLVILVYRWERDNHGKIVKELMNYGFSGIYRPVYIVTEPLIEMSNLHICVDAVPEAYVDQFTDEKSIEKQLVSKVTRGSYKLKADFKIRNHTDYIMPYAVRVSVMEARSEYDPYKLPYARIDIKATPGGTVDAHTTITDSFELTAVDVAQWSDATPVQYDLILELLDSEERIVCVKKRRFGFRTTGIVKNKFSINDKALPLLLVKYYEFDPKGGITVNLDRFRQDVVLMKRCGINGIISQGFPLNEKMLDLCDQYGLYVIAVCDARYMRDYVESSMNHPCVIMWGFNDYAFNSANCLKVKSECKVLDNTRPWYCGVDFNMSVSDMYPMPCEAGVVFGPWEDLCIDRNYVFGANKLSINLFETIPGRTRFADDSADYKWIHHADLVGGKQKVNSSIGQGIVDSERNPHPIFHDIRKQCQSVNIFASPEDPSTLTLRNNHPFAYTPELILEWKVLLGGKTIMSGKGNISEIEPDGIRNLRFPLNVNSFLEEGWGESNNQLLELYNSVLSHEIVFDVSLKLASRTYFASENFEIAFYQDVLLEDCACPIKKSNENQLLIESSVDQLSTEDNILLSELPSEEFDVSKLDDEFSLVAQVDNISVSNEKYGFTFSRKKGALNGIRVGDKEFLMGDLIPSFYRCPSNIDRTDRNFVLAKTIFSKESDYEEIQESLEYVGSNYSVKDGIFSYISRYKSFAMKGEILVSYEIPSADKILITLSFTPKYDMIRYGFRVPVSKDGVLCTWYGRGPGESYYDRKNATRIGVFSAGVDKIYHPYARPAENSSHTDTKVVRFSSENGETFSVRRVTPTNVDSKFDFTVLPFTPEQMNEFLHEELLMQNEFCELFLDFCSKEIERTVENTTSLPLKKNVQYKETFEIKLNN